jgi:hypothetical protein
MLCARHALEEESHTRSTVDTFTATTLESGMIRMIWFKVNYRNGLQRKDKRPPGAIKTDRSHEKRM